ncbi:MAG: NAD(P)H-dependent oxidoreductase subunit E [Anaerolineales bacterium]|nr:NAD(P)H-dependent oxidoreductase subunit E [Anaerolineales bacterium]
MLKEKYAQEIDHILAKFPPDHSRSAVMPLLFLALREQSYVTEQAITEIAEILSISRTQVRSIVGFYTLYQERPGGKYRIQVCGDLPCALRGAEEFLSGLYSRLGISPDETTEDGLFSVEEVMCLAACDRAPVFQLQGPDGVHYYENQTVDSAMEILEQIRQREQNA